MGREPRKPFFVRLQAGLEEGIAHAQGQMPLKTTVFPAPPPEIDGPTVARLRLAARMSQAAFAEFLFVSPKTVQSWEQGKRQPSKAARRLIHVLVLRPDAVCEAVGVEPLQFAGFTIVTTGKVRRVVERPSARRDASR